MVNINHKEGNIMPNSKKKRITRPDYGHMIRHEGIINAQSRIVEMNVAINVTQNIVDYLKDRNLTEHSDYLHYQILPNFRTNLEQLSEIIKGTSDLLRRPKRDKIIDIVENLKQNYGYFERFVAGFDDDREYSFKAPREQIKVNLDELVIFLNQAGLQYVPKKGKKTFAEQTTIKATPTAKTR